MTRERWLIAGGVAAALSLVLVAARDTPSVPKTTPPELQSTDPDRAPGVAVAVPATSSPPRQPVRTRAGGPHDPMEVFRKARTHKELNRGLIESFARALRQGPEAVKEMLLALQAAEADPDISQRLRELGNDDSVLELLGHFGHWVEFLADHKGRVQRLVDELVAKAADDPGWFEGLESDTLAYALTGLGWLAAAVRDDDGRARVRRSLERFLAWEPAVLPDGLRAQRQRLADLAKSIDEASKIDATRE